MQQFEKEMLHVIGRYDGNAEAKSVRFTSTRVVYSNYDIMIIITTLL